jgi:cell division protein FtsA
MRNKIAVGIDIGTYQVKVVITEGVTGKGGLPKIIGVGYAESKGLRHGYIINQTDAIRSIRKAVRQAEKTSKVKVEKAFVSIGGIGLSSYTSNGHIMISRADSEITEIDIEKVNEEVKRNIPNTVSINHQIIHTIPIEYKIDGKQVFGDPVGLKGNKLEAKILYINCLTHHISELITAVENSGIEIVDAVASPIAAGIINLSRTERVAGCVMVNIGSETVSMVVYEEDVPIAIEVFKVGSNDITNDIALGMQVSLEEAEKMKQDTRGWQDSPTTASKKTPEGKLQSIITNRLEDVFKLVENHLKKIDRSGLLPAGIILTGGGSGITSAEDLAKATLNLPSRVAQIANHRTANATNDLKVKDSTWSVAYGLCVYGLTFESDETGPFGKGSKVFKNTFRQGVNFVKKLLP